MGEKYEFPTLFSSLFNQIFPQHVIWPYFPPSPGGGQTEKYTPLIIFLQTAENLIWRSKNERANKP